MSNQQRAAASGRKRRTSYWWTCGGRTSDRKVNAAKQFTMQVIGASNLEAGNLSIPLTAKTRRERRRNPEVVAVILAAIPQGS
jgi:hypothetical protein